MIKKGTWWTILDIDILMKKRIQWSLSILSVTVNEKQIVEIIATFFFFFSLFIYLIIYRKNFNFNFEENDE